MYVISIVKYLAFRFDVVVYRVLNFFGWKIELFIYLSDDYLKDDKYRVFWFYLEILYVDTLFYLQSWVQNYIWSTVFYCLYEYLWVP